MKKKFRRKNIFYDLAIASSKKKRYNNQYSSYNDINSELVINGTKVYSETPIEGFYFINRVLDQNLNYEFTFKWVDGDFVTPIIQIREVSDMDALISFQKQNSDEWQIFSKGNNSDRIDFNGVKPFIKKSINKNEKIKLLKLGNRFKVYCGNKLVIDYTIDLQSNFYIGFGGHSYGKRFTIFKEVELKELY